MSTPRIRLADVAALAGVSKATASRALSRPELVLPETAARVLAAAEQLGFVANRAARQLARGRSGLVALVVPTLENSYFTPVIAGAQALAGEHDVQLTVAVHPLAHPDELVAFERLSAQVDGFIVVAPRGPDEVVAAAASSKPTVLVDREVAGLSSVVADTAAAFGSLVARLVDDGHERIVYVGGPEGSWQDAQRTEAVTRAAHGRASLVRLGPFPSTFAAGVSVLPAVLEARATAVVPYATAIGLGLMFALGRPARLLPGRRQLGADGRRLARPRRGPGDRRRRRRAGPRRDGPAARPGRRRCGRGAAGGGAAAVVRAGPLAGSAVAGRVRPGRVVRPQRASVSRGCSPKRAT